MYSSISCWPGWEIVDKIGQGSFGAVYKIEREFYGIKEQAALKVISIPQNKSDIEEMYNDGYDEESVTETINGYVNDIIKEYALMKKLSGNTNIVNCEEVHIVKHKEDIGCDILIKMELLTPLVKSLDKEIPVDTALKIGTDLCKALILCQNESIVHRDIKPENIFVSDYGDYKLGDFGVAKTVEKTVGGTKIGTYKYMAPEVYNNQPYGSAADIYSLGLVMYWLLNEKRMPFMPLPPEKIKAGSNEESRARRLSGEALPPPHNGSDELKAIVLKACAYKVEDRYRRADELLRDLNSVAQGKKVDTPKAAESVKTTEDECNKVTQEPSVKNTPEVETSNSVEEKKGNDFSVGEIVEIGTYYNKPIQWRVLRKENDSCLLFCENGLDPRVFDASEKTEWESSSLRTWLNSSFLNLSFTNEEKRCIPISQVTADRNVEDKTPAGMKQYKDTLDSLFLLSTSEMYVFSNWFKDAEDCRICKETDSKGRTICKEWWLRTPGIHVGDSMPITYVDTTGKVNWNGQRQSAGYLAVAQRCGLTISLLYLPLLLIGMSL